MSELFAETNPNNIKECYKNLKASSRMILDETYELKDLEYKLKIDYAEFRDFRDKKGNPLPKKVKATFLKIIYNLLNTDKKSEGIKLLKEQEILLNNVLESFEDNEKNNTLFKLGAGKKPEDIEELIQYIIDYKNNDLDNQLIDTIINKINSITKIKEEQEKILNDFVGLIPKDETIVIKELVKNVNIPYVEKLEKEFLEKYNLKAPVKKEKHSIEENDIQKLSRIVNEKITNKEKD